MLIEKSHMGKRIMKYTNQQRVINLNCTSYQYCKRILEPIYKHIMIETNRYAKPILEMTATLLLRFRFRKR